MKKYGDMLRTIILSMKSGGKFTPEFLDELQRTFNQLGERLQAAEDKIAQLERERDVKTN